MYFNFSSMNRTRDLQSFLTKINNINKRESLNISMESVFFSSPQITVACAGIIDFLKQNGVKTYVNYNNNMLSTSGFNKPYTVSENSYDLLSPMFKVWKYETSKDVFDIVAAFIEYINTKEECAKGVVEAFEWTVYEVMDNVLQHSGASCGYVMCTVTQNAHISVAVYDNGIGIYRSFYNSGFRFKKPVDAIIASMEKGRTRDNKHNQGNGLWGMTQLVLLNKGSLSIISSGEVVGYNSNKDLFKHDMRFANFNRTHVLPGTLVDCQFKCDSDVSISEVFGNEYAHTNLFLESLEDDKNRLNIKISDLSFGYATREAGERARAFAINMATQSCERQVILLDFENVNIVSSSFADEFVAKLIIHYGLLKFNNLFRIVNLREINAPTINHAIMQRISTEFSDKK